MAFVRPLEVDISTPNLIIQQDYTFGIEIMTAMWCRWLAKVTRMRQCKKFFGFGVEDSDGMLAGMGDFHESHDEPSNKENPSLQPVPVPLG
ncbi:hypothetical protein CCACVL1_19822 [Corchorus capsularis]|uniref:Uncharacterized protein n=1 Tax=Corchorus capsularis TaxID=210143 RepID=A0A1R3HEN0_COCAP|nr:hypothetical protein CCACVL1_19822 [Corchorus capsularis]